MYTAGLPITHSARKHGVTDADMQHAARHFLWELYDRDPGGALLHLVVGPTVSGQLLELVIVDPLEEPAIIHTMAARKAFIDRIRRP